MPTNECMVALEAEGAAALSLESRTDPSTLGANTIERLSAVILLCAAWS